VVKFLEGFNEQIVHRKPDRPTPVRVAAEESRGQLRRLIVHPVFGAVDRQDIGVLRVILRHGANAVWRAVYAHPAGAVGLLEVPARGQWGRAVKDADVVQP
jgi:hypothetical protein